MTAAGKPLTGQARSRSDQPRRDRPDPGRASPRPARGARRPPRRRTARSSGRCGRWPGPSRSCCPTAPGTRCSMCTRACSRRRCRRRRRPTVTGSRSATPTAARELLIDDPYRHLPTLGEMDLHLIGEGRHEELWQRARRQGRPELGGTSFAVWAPSARGVRRDRRLQPLGWPRASDALARQLRRLGAVHARSRLRRAVQVRDLRSGRRLAPQGRSDGGTGRGSARDRVRRVRVRLRVGRPGLDDSPRRARSAARADERLRGSHRLLAARPFLRRARRCPC